MTIDTKRVETSAMEMLRLSSQHPRTNKLGALLADGGGLLLGLVKERDRLLRGEHICIRCGIRQDAEGSGISKEF